MYALSGSPLPALWVLSWLLPAWALSQATSTVWAWSAAATRSSCRPPSSRLIKLHMQTLRLNPHAGRRPQYTMHTLRLQLVTDAPTPPEKPE